MASKTSKYFNYLLLISSLLLFEIVIANRVIAKAIASTATESNEQMLELEKITDLNYASKIVFKSKILAQSIPMNIYLPSSFYESSEEHTYPVIFINGSHGNRFFLTLSGVVKHLGELERMPEAIIVSLNWSGHFPELFINGMWDGSRETMSGYGDPDNYVSHLRLELFPFLSKHFRANEYRMIIGVSASSIFPLYSFTHAPELFDAHIFLAAMDMIGMGYKKGETIISSIKQSMSHRTNKQTALYFALADDDLDKPEYEVNINQLAANMKPFVSEQFKFELNVIPNEHHYAAFTKTILGAMEMIFPSNLWAPDYRDLIAKPGDAMANIDKFFIQLSKQYGFKILPKADRWNSVNCLRFAAGKLLRDGRIDEALTVANRWVQYRPDSAPAYDQLGDVLEMQKSFKAALNARQKAIEIARKKNLWDLKNYQETLENLKKKL
ncbi:MAG: alpha/beta hydrolase-fold protein [Kangiellaceae bacterium]